MKKRNFIKPLVAFLLLFSNLSNAQAKNDLNVILITIDGLRWQEVFTGSDSLLVANKKYVNDTIELKEKFWRKSPSERRTALMPFLWNQVSKMGQIHGNREMGSKVNLTNNMYFSYPGYNEILTGAADDQRINSNRKINNPNKTVLEIINNVPDYKGKVAAFGSWDVFPYIINTERSGIPVNAGFDVAKGEVISEREEFLNELQSEVPSPWGTVRFDAFTHHYALEFVKKHHPKMLYIAYGETDDFAHDGDYQAYLKSANNTDRLINDMWDFTQNDPFYKDNTIFLVTTDHGRGTQPLETWKSHGTKIENSNQVWLIIFGKGVKAKGEIRNQEQLYSNQIAPTILNLLGIDIDKGKVIDIKE